VLDSKNNEVKECAELCEWMCRTIYERPWQTATLGHRGRVDDRQAKVDPSDGAKWIA
jgi:hypothetical protein